MIPVLLLFTHNSVQLIGNIFKYFNNYKFFFSSNFPSDRLFYISDLTKFCSILMDITFQIKLIFIMWVNFINQYARQIKCNYLMLSITSHFNKWVFQTKVGKWKLSDSIIFSLNLIPTAKSQNGRPANLNSAWKCQINFQFRVCFFFVKTTNQIQNMKLVTTYLDGKKLYNKIYTSHFLEINFQYNKLHKYES